MDNGNKKARRILTTNDIRKLAQDWTLAGDVGLLAHLEQFSENIVSKTQETQKNFNELVDDFDELYTKVGNITNQFLALQNCQFVENRVYDEETPTEEKQQVKVENAGEQEKQLLMQYKEAVEVGIKLLDTHFQEVQLPPNSDSDEEDEISIENSIIWKPKNPYAGKKFPYLIGSAEWWADDHVGLGTNEDILDTEKNISESESEMESLKSAEKTKSTSSSSLENVKPVPAKPAFLESSSEDLFGFEKTSNQKSDSTKGSTSLLSERVTFLPEPETETGTRTETETKTKKTDSPSENRFPEEISNLPRPKVENAFTRELMAKLVSVTNKTKPEIQAKEKTKEKEKVETKAEESLFDETDDSSDLFSRKMDRVPEKPSGRKKSLLVGEAKGEGDLFGGGGDLFVKNLEVGMRKSPVNDLFGDLDDDDTLFDSQQVKTKEKEEKSLAQNQWNTSLSWGVEEELFEDIKTGYDDDLFSSSSGLFDAKVSKVEDSETNVKENLFVEESPEATTKPEKLIFESIVDDPFGFSSSSIKPVDKKINLLDSDEDEDLFSTSFKGETKSSIKPSMPPPEDDDTALFEDKPKLPDSVSMSSSRSSLFDDSNASKSCLASVFEKDKKEDLFEGTTEDSKESKKNSLFDECDDGDDLFSSDVKGTVSEEMLSKSSPKPKPPSNLSLKTKPVGKLNISDNLKVRFESVAKNISPGLKPPKEEKKEEEKDDSLDVEPQPSALLKCPSKDRVKIPGRRRPQSRRARQEAIRNSGAWEQPSLRSPSPIPSNPLSPSTDEEDFFKVPELDTNFEKEDQSIFKSDLFESNNSKLFDGAPVLSPLSPKKTATATTTPETEALFGSVKSKAQTFFDDYLEEDENLFKPSSARFQPEEKPKKSLFDLDDEEEDDEDLFGDATHVSVTKPPPSVGKPKREGEGDAKKKENSSFVDPLGLITKG